MENNYNFKPFDKVLVRDKNKDVWRADFFEKCENSTSGVFYQGMTTFWRQCIPYEGNEHLLGTTDSPQEECPKEEVEKQDEVNNNYGYPVEYFKQKDLVLCRDGEGKHWDIDVFLYNVDSASYPFRCNNNVWRECIPYKDNEYLLGTTDTPKKYNSNNDTLFEIKLKPGYVLEFVNGSTGVLFPIRKTESPYETFFAVMFDNGSWDKLDDIDSETITAIHGVPYYGCCLTSSEYLWEKEE